MHYLTPEAISQFISRALAEDVGPGDYSTLASVPADALRRARLLCKSEGIMAGHALAIEIFRHVNPRLTVDSLILDGESFVYGDIAFTVEGPAQSILTTERLVLNTMQRMAGIASYTHRLAQMIAHTPCKLLDTRKTTPGFRLAEKWAVAIGGGRNHRYGLFDMVMLKDNHIDFCGGVAPAIKATKRYLAEHGLDLHLEVEVRNPQELDEALTEGGILRVLLDNMSPDQVAACVAQTAGRCQTEASGGIDERNLVGYAEAGVDFISMGALTYKAPTLDMSLKSY